MAGVYTLRGAGPPCYGACTFEATDAVKYGVDKVMELLKQEGLPEQEK